MNTQENNRQLCNTIESLIIKGNLNYLTELLDVITKNCDEKMLLQVNRILSKPQNLKLIISKIVNTKKAFEKVLKNSYPHKNGFHKIVLLSGKFFKLRLHHFKSMTDAPMENIHDHRWIFASSILYGELEMEIYEVNNETNEGEELLHYKYNSNKSTGAYTTNLIGKTFLRPTQRVKLNAGKSYCMLPQYLHRILNKENAETITLILTGKPTSYECNLFAKREINEEEKNILSYSTEELSNHLQVLAEQLYPQNN